MRWIIYAAISIFAVALLSMTAGAQEYETHIYKKPAIYCPDYTWSYDDFKAETQREGMVMLSARGLPLSKILAELNRTRVEAGVFSFEADNILVGVWSNDGKINVSFALFQDGCLLPGTSMTKTVYEWLKIAEAAGVTFDDFRAEGEDA